MYIYLLLLLEYVVLWTVDQKNLKNDKLNGWQILPWWSRFSCLTPLFVYWTINFIFCLSKSNVNNTTEDIRIYPSHATFSKTFILFFLCYAGECGKDKLGMTFWLSKPTRIHDTFITFSLKFVIVFYCYPLFTPVCGINNLRANYEEANQLTYLKILLVTLYYLCWWNSLFQYLYLWHLHCADIYSTLLRDCSHQVKASPEAISLQKDINAIPFTVQIKDTVHIISFEPISERLTSKSIQELSVILLWMDVIVTIWRTTMRELYYIV